MTKRLLGMLAGVGLSLTTLTAANLTGFTPSQGEPGTQVSITGTGLGTTTEVRFNNTLADFSVLGNGALLAIVPLEATTGPLQVKVSSSTTLNTSSNFMVAPRITSFSPTRGATNTTVVVYGANLLSVTNVEFAGLAAAFRTNTQNQLNVTVPAEATNNLVGPFRFMSPAGVAVSPEEFLVMGSAPYVDGLSQDVAAPGTVIQIWGANFVGTTNVTFSNQTARFAVSSASQLNVTVPTNPVPTTPLTNLIRVVSAGGTGLCNQPFRITRAPVITNIVPPFEASGRSVRLEGINFSNVTSVGFGGVQATDYVLSANQITVTIPTNATNGPAKATNAYGFGAHSFDVTRAPVLDNSFVPEEGQPGTRVAIFGANLFGPGAVLFNGKPSPWVQSPSQLGLQVNAEVPAGATTGPITVTNTYGSATTTNDFVVPGSLPFLSAISPPGGPRGTRVIINGGNFTNVQSVKFNGVPAPGAAASSRSQINATVPVGVFTGPVTVTTSAGTSTNTQVFYASPRLTTFAPTNGINGDPVVLTGTNFTGALAVNFGEGNARFTVNNTNRITAVIPTNATTGPIRILTPGGAILSTTNFVVFPFISDFMPRWGPTGAVVQIFGSSLEQASGVAFGGVAAPRFSILSPTRLQATVPAGATTGPIQVTTPDGVAVSSNRFVVTGSADLRLHFDSWTELVTPGDSVADRVQVINQGPLAASGVRVVYDLPPGMVLGFAQSDLGLCTFTNQTVTCDVAILEPWDQVSVTAGGTYPQEGVFQQAATVSAQDPDPDSLNNQDSVRTVVISDSSRTLKLDGTADGSQVRISWPTSPVLLTLQTVTNLSSPGAWLAVTNLPSVIGGRNWVTNPVTGTSQFYRLREP
jgi:hypothetical protein